MNEVCEIKIRCEGNPATTKLVVELSEQAVRLGAPETTEFKICDACRDELYKNERFSLG